MTSSGSHDAPQETSDLKRKVVRGAIALAVLVAVLIGILVAVPGLHGVRSAIAGASPPWILAACVIQLAGFAGAAIFVQSVFDELPRRLSWWQGCAMQGANAVLPTAGSTGVSYWSVSALGWPVSRFVDRTAVMVIAPAAPNVLLIVVVGIGMGLGLLAGPGDWWLTWLPAAIALVVAVGAVAAAAWGHRLAPRIKRRAPARALEVVATGVTGTVAVLRRRSWRVLGTWIDLLAAIGVLWASLAAVGTHVPFAVVAMGYLIGQFAQVIPIPGGIGAMDAGVTGALVLYGAPSTITTAGELISHAIALLIALAIGAVASVFLPRAIATARAQHDADARHGTG